MSSTTITNEQQLVGVQWRLDVPIATRECPRPSAAVAPQYVLAISTNSSITSHGNQQSLEVANKNNATQNAADGSSGSVSFLSAGAVASNSPSTTPDTTQWVTCDVETAINVTKGIEDALSAMWSSGYRRINKMVK